MTLITRRPVESHRLIVEEPIFNELEYIIEEKNKDAPSNLIIQGPYLMAENANKNKRKYKKEEMISEVSRYTTEMIKTNRAMGELNHPQSADINLERACHVITELRQDGNIWLGKSKVLNTPMGLLVKSLLLDGVKLGVSSRALGRLIPSGDCNLVENLRLIAVDCVADPSVPSAFVNGILESKEWVLRSDGTLEECYSNFEHSISTLPRKGSDDYLREHILKFINELKANS